MAKSNYGYDRPSTSIFRDWIAVTALVLGWMLGVIAIGFGLIHVFSKTGKLRQRETLLGSIPWRGDERVLDVGCGPGLLLVEAAKKLTTGKADGVDIWDKAVETANLLTTALRNPKLKG